MAGAMRSLCGLTAVTWSATLIFWSSFSACFDTSDHGARVPDELIAMWDPVSCGPPHQVVVEIQDDTGARIDASAPCDLGELRADVPELGEYQGRAYAWDPGHPIRSIEPVSVAIDRPALKWVIPTPE